jgi:Holliday junction resolvase
VTGVVLPLPEPPDHELDQVLELIEFARSELAEAHRTVTMLTSDDWQVLPWAEMRRRIEASVAERRAELWAEQLAKLAEREQQLRARS